MAVSRNSNIYCGCSVVSHFILLIKILIFKENEAKLLWVNKLGKEELINRRNMWAINLKMGKETLRKTQLQVCSLHFTENDFMPSS